LMIGGHHPVAGHWPYIGDLGTFRTRPAGLTTVKPIYGTPSAWREGICPAFRKMPIVTPSNRFPEGPSPVVGPRSQELCWAENLLTISPFRPTTPAPSRPGPMRALGASRSRAPHLAPRSPATTIYEPASWLLSPGSSHVPGKQRRLPPTSLVFQAGLEPFHFGSFAAHPYPTQTTDQPLFRSPSGFRMPAG